MEQVAWVGGDSTLEVAGQIDWAAKHYAKQELGGYMDALKEAAGLPEERVIIALGELSCAVGFAVARGRARRGQLIIYAGDNQTVQRWIESRRPKNRMARHLVRLLIYVEAKYHCRILAAPYMRTYSSEMADMITRADEAV
eukprot:58898-Pyramimonas_sp.AAC.1